MQQVRCYARHRLDLLGMISPRCFASSQPRGNSLSLWGTMPRRWHRGGILALVRRWCSRGSVKICSESSYSLVGRSIIHSSRRFMPSWPLGCSTARLLGRLCLCAGGQRAVGPAQVSRRNCATGTSTLSSQSSQWVGHWTVARVQFCDNRSSPVGWRIRCRLVSKRIMLPRLRRCQIPVLSMCHTVICDTNCCFGSRS